MCSGQRTEHSSYAGLKISPQFVGGERFVIQQN
jgi:hypothetical protein